MGIFKDSWEDSALGVEYGRGGFEILAASGHITTAGRTFYEVTAWGEAATVTGNFAGTDISDPFEIPEGYTLRGDIRQIRVLSGKILGYIDDSGS